MALYTNQIELLYVAYFGRPADHDGLNYWEKVVTAKGGSTTFVADVFSTTAEYQNAYRGLTPSQSINQIYIQLFGHPADPAGLAYWSKGLENGNFTMGNAVTTIAAGARTTDYVALSCKVAGASAFTASLDTPGEILAYSGDYANAKGKAYIGSITDVASLDAAVKGLDYHIQFSESNDSITIVGTPTEPLA